MCDYQKAYYKVIMPEIRKAIAELKVEMGDWGKERRRLYLSEQLTTVQSEIKSIHAKYKHLTVADAAYIEKQLATITLDDWENDLKKIQSEIRHLNNLLNGVVSSDSITTDMIEQARNYPFEELVDLQRGKALCPFHDDHNPSMGIKNNRYKCFSCGESGDVIDFVVKLEGLNFVQAVKRLQT